jgi:hypothetical protein
MPEEYKGYDRERTEHIEQRNGEVGDTEWTSSTKAAVSQAAAAAASGSLSASSSSSSSDDNDSDDS